MFNLLLIYSIFLKSLIIGEVEVCSLEVKLTNLESTEGNLIVAIFDNEDTFLKKELKSISLDGKSDEVILFIDLSPGNYAVSVIHDKNKNGVLDTNVMGIPTEKFGFSNNKMGMFGPPKFKDCLVALDKEQTSITIEMKKIF